MNAATPAHLSPSAFRPTHVCRGTPSPAAPRPAAAAPRPSAANRTARLSPREEEILSLLADGRLYKEIAQALGIATGTVRTHVGHIYAKLQAHNRTEALRRAGA